MWAKLPQIDEWLKRLKATQAYEIGMVEWHNQLNRCLL